MKLGGEDDGVDHVRSVAEKYKKSVTASGDYET